MLHLSAALAVVTMVIAGPPATQSEAEAQAASLMAADRGFSEEASRAADPLAVYAAMLDQDIIVPHPRQGLIKGREAVLQMLRSDAGRPEWQPIRAGISADGRHGFTFGYVDVEGGDPERRWRRYLAYWVKRPEGWRVLALRHAIRRPDETKLGFIPFSLPPRPGTVIQDDQTASLAAAEQAFSDRAQKVGLRAAFTEFGRSDAVNVGSAAGFVLGPEEIGRALFDEAKASPVHWKADHVVVAPSGDLGITFGLVRTHAPAAGEPEAFPFFTIWRRDGAGQPWRYVAE